jgi:hypothetical protein
MAGGGAERTCGGNSDASSASGAPTCASHRMRQRIPEQCARGAPTTAAVGYCSVLCGNGTATLPDSTCHTTRLLDGTHAITRNADHAPCGMRHTRPTSDAQQTLCRRRAGWHRGVLKGCSRGTQGVPRGTQGYSDRGWNACKHFERGPCTVRHAARTFNQRCAAIIVADDAPARARRMALRGTQGYSAAVETASMQQAQWLVQQSIAARMPRGICIRPPLRDGLKLMEDPTGAVGYYSVRVRPMWT